MWISNDYKNKMITKEEDSKHKDLLRVKVEFFFLF